MPMYSTPSLSVGRASFSLLFACVMLLALGTDAAESSTSGPRFNTDIRPVLANSCFACHGPDEKKRKAGLRLDVAEGPFEDREGEGAVIVAGDVEASELIRRIMSTEPDEQMPPPDSGKALSDRDRSELIAWVGDGARFEEHWAFLKPEPSPLPDVSLESWSKNEIDSFVLAQLEEKGILPSPEADPVTLLRRVYSDLTGLLPPIDVVQRFVRKPSDKAYGKIVNELLASPHFGERWGRHWLDAARYADSNGYSVDSPRSLWKYRDWVVDAFNADKPFDEFAVEQLAGDLLPDATKEQQTATGLHRNTMINEEGGIDKEEFRIKAIIDRVNTTGSIFFGLTIGCAQCHSHKYDPISQEEYYRFYAFLNNDDEHRLEVSTQEERDARDEHRAKVRQRERELKDYLLTKEESEIPEWESSLSPNLVAKLPSDQRAALEVTVAERSSKERHHVRQAFAKSDDDAAEQRRGIDALRKRTPKVTTTLALKARAEPRETHIQIQGDFTRLGELVTPGTPEVLHPMKLSEGGTGTRLDLARWIADSENPLTSRVIMNRFWQRLFGRGIVETENDFGIQGIPPTHPELLDWLALEFQREQWSMKAMLRKMVTSATYRQASLVRADLAEIDPTNRLLARQTRLRKDAEIIRDSALVASGLLHERVGGPSVFPPQPDGVMTLGQQSRPWRISKGEDRYRRGMYTFFWRATPYPAMTVFDAPDAMTTCTKRVRSNTPLQALTLLNDASFYEFAEALGARIIRDGGEDASERIRHGFLLCLSREPTTRESELMAGLLEGKTESHAWTTVARVLLNSDEFITRE